MALTQVRMLVRSPECAVLDTWFKPFAYLPTATLVEATVDDGRMPEQPEELVQIVVPGSRALAPHNWGWTRWGYLDPLRGPRRTWLERLVGPDPW
jgi:hypothetical protein